MTTPDLEALLLGGVPELTQAEMSRQAGVPDAFVTRVWRALGFADPAPDEPAFTPADVAAMRDAAQLQAAGVVDAPTLLAMTRAMGQSLARLADWQVDAVADYVLRHPDAEPTAAAGELLPVMERLLLQVWRRHLAAAAARGLGAAAEAQVGVRTLCVGFADLTGFTGLSRRLSETELAALVERFESTAAEFVAVRGGRIVKTIGDEVLYVVDAPVDAAAIGLGLAAMSGEEEDLPPVRVGMAYGAVATRLGDVFGVPVNLASRLTGLARPGTVLVDRELAAALEGTRYSLRPLRRRSVRGFDHLEPVLLRPARQEERG